MGDSVLAALSRKLGIASNDVIRKAAEFQRIVEVRCGSSLASLNLSNTATAVICLEFAANASGLSFTKTTAIQLSGLTKKLYINAYKAIECILGKQKMVTLRDFAVMFGCVSSVPFAEEVLGSYKSTQNGAVDLDQPVFAAATLYVVCRSKKVRLDKSKLITQINVKRSIFDNVCKQIQPFLDNVTVTNREECTSYTSLSNNDRNVNYVGSSTMCDDGISTGWYRFVGNAGTQISASCIPRHDTSILKCSTHGVSWLNGAHPSVGEGEVTRTVCFSWSGNCCAISKAIKVINCGLFYVYKLVPTGSCSYRYCGSDV